MQTPSSEKNCVICGPEFGLERSGKKALVVRELYEDGGKTMGVDFLKHLHSCMQFLGFKSFHADPDIFEFG